MTAHPRDQTALRLFLTCWLVYGMHAATNVVREHYLTFAIGDRFTFRVDEYRGLHPDLFEIPGRGWHINSNPGASMLAALPYAVARPAIDAATRVALTARARRGGPPPAYDSPWPMAREFYAEAWRRGLDVKLGLGALTTQLLCMAPLSAGFAVLMFRILRGLVGSGPRALALALLYAFGTPVFFRTGYLNHNLLAGYASAAGFLVLVSSGPQWWSERKSALIAGLCGGAAVLLDYSTVPLLAALAVYLPLARPGRVLRLILADGIAFAAGALIALAPLWFYQWVSFGNPWLPAQHWMPDVAWATQGYRGLSWPQADLLWRNLLDHRYGLLVACPLLALALVEPWLKRDRALVPRREASFMLAVVLAYWVFVSGIGYGRLQFNTGVRYMSTIVPWMFPLAASALLRLPGLARFALLATTVTISWCLSMYRDVEQPLGILDPVARAFAGGFQLPILTTLERMEAFRRFAPSGASSLPALTVAGICLWWIWRTPASAGSSEGRRN